MKIESSYSPFAGKWMRQWPECVSQHDVFYGTPPDDPMLGLPIGNGDLGALIWTEGGKLVMQVNKNDTWDDNPSPEVHNWGRPEEDYMTATRHCGRLVVDFRAPVFDLIYQQDFEGRMDLAGASAQFHGKTPFADVHVNAFASHEYKTIVVECEIDRTDATSLEAVVERWGSRTFSHWYSLVRRNAEIGLDGTETTLRGDDTILIRQQLRSQYFVFGAKIVAEGPKPAVELFNARSGSFSIAREVRQKFTIYLTAFVSESEPDPEQAVLSTLNAAASAGSNAVRAEHERTWKDFWEKAFVEIPEKYVENIWHLNLYYANSSNRGAYPPHFCNGIWGHNRDYVPWNYYFHWNMQYLIAPMFAANHLELAKPYFDFRSAQLPHAIEYCRNFKKKAGAFYADVADRYGRNDHHSSNNNTPSAQIALEFWRFYQFTLDRAFFLERAWPVIRGAAEFYADMFVKESDGKYHIYRTQAYEGTPLLNDTVTDVTMAKALFPIAVEAARMAGFDGDDLVKWNDMAANIVDLLTVPLFDDEYSEDENGLRLEIGLGRGMTLETNRVFSVGKYVTLENLDEDNPDYSRYPPEISGPVKNYKKGDLIRSRFKSAGHQMYYGVPDSEMVPVYPTGIVGLSNRNSDLFRIARNQIAIHPTSIPDKSAAGSMYGDETGICMGWCAYPIAMARVGLAEALSVELGRLISTWQFYCQGFGHYGPYAVFYKDLNNRWATNLVKDADSRDRYETPKWNFRHFDNEAMPIVATATSEMLLQSHEGVIRVCPALIPEWNAGFRLAAAKGFVVDCASEGGDISWICVESKLGAQCDIVSPWAGPSAFLTAISGDGNVMSEVEIKTSARQDDMIFSFDTEKDTRYLLCPSRGALDTWSVVPAAYEKNRKYKTLGDAKLGLARNF